jgi:DNA-binding response OmpR family regulator
MNARPAILVIDDEPGMRDMLRYELTMEGFDVETADSGMAAVEAVKRRKFDVAVTDLKMAGMDGIATVEALRALDAGLEVIVATGYATVETAVACMKKGAYDLIQKPFDLVELRGLLGRAMEKSELQGVIALYEASNALLATFDHADVVRLVITLAQRVLHADEAALVLDVGDGKREVMRACSKSSCSDAAVLALVGQALREGKPWRFPDDGSTESDVAALVFPLATRERSGALVVLRQTSNAFTAAELRKGAVLANQLSLSLDNAHLYERLESKISELVATREQVIHAEKLSLAARLAGSVAHEVNNPLTVVHANLESLHDYSSVVGSLWLAAKEAAIHLRGYQTPLADAQAQQLCVGDQERTERLIRDIAEIVDDTLDSVRRVAELVTGFRHLADFKSARMAPQIVDVMAVLAECRESVPGLVEIEPCSREVRSLVDASDLRTALLNIIDHLCARKRRCATPARITIAVAELRDRVRISIKDRLLELDDNGRRRFFDPGIQLDSQGQTMRLNISLAVSYQLLRRNGGELDVVGYEGGSAINIVLPMLQGVS